MRAKQQHVCKEMNIYDQYQPIMDSKFRPQGLAVVRCTVLLCAESK